jgi:5-methylcytosine-specific restriction protein A
MTREVPEWKAKHDDEPIPTRVKVRIFERCAGRCAISGRKVRAGEYDFDHIIALANGGEHRERNLQVISRDKHREKTVADLAVKSKIARTKAKHLGLWPKPARKLQGRGFDKRRTA